MLIGERASEEVNRSITELARATPGVEGANGALTLHLAPDQIAVALSLEFADSLTAPEIEENVVSLEKRIRERHTEVVALFIKPQSRRTFEKALDERYYP